MEIQRSQISSHAHLPPRPAGGGFAVKLKDEAGIAHGQLGALMAALQAYYGLELTERDVTAEDRDPRHFIAVTMALAGKGLRLEVDPPEVMQVGGRTETTLTFYVVRM